MDGALTANHAGVWPLILGPLFPEPHMDEKMNVLNCTPMLHQTVSADLPQTGLFGPEKGPFGPEAILNEAWWDWIGPPLFGPRILHIPSSPF